MDATTDRVLAKAKAARALPAPAMRRQTRIAAGLSQSDVAEAIGVCRATVAHYERGSRNPRGEHLVRYVEVLRALREVS